MRVLYLLLQPLTIFVSFLLLATVLLDAYTYAWNTSDSGTASLRGGLSTCTPWNFKGCKSLWTAMNTHHRIALISQVCAVPLNMALILIMTVAFFTRAMRKRISVPILIVLSWLTFFAVVISFVLRLNKINETLLRRAPSVVKEHGYYLHREQPWHVYTSLASLLLSFLITQVFAIGGYVRPMITQLTFEGHYQRYNYPRNDKHDKHMVTVKQLDSF